MRVHRPYLIQRGTITPATGIVRYSEAVRDDYMGASEFEWGAKPASLRRMQAERTTLRTVAAPDVRDAKGRPLLMYGNFTRIDPVAYSAAIGDLAGGRARAKEWTAFDDQISPRPITIPARYRTKRERERYVADENARRTNVWWDIGNDVMMSFDGEFMDRLPKILEESWAYMDAQKEVSA